jgi:hypothetical protein
VTSNQSRAASFSLLPDQRMMEGWCVNRSTWTAKVRSVAVTGIRQACDIQIRPGRYLVCHLGSRIGQVLFVSGVHGACEHEL